VLQLRGDLALLDEAPRALGLACDHRMKQLERDAPSELEVLGLVDAAHAALTEETLDAVAADGAPDGSGRRVLLGTGDLT
jgi:hypothetical protein